MGLLQRIAGLALPRGFFLRQNLVETIPEGLGRETLGVGGEDVGVRILWDSNKSNRAVADEHLAAPYPRERRVRN
ncbi:MAG: hypothetical protein ACRD3O_00170 [Terriglobia bacterium]